jgi:signal transduction histidine kinase
MTLRARLLSVTLSMVAVVVLTLAALNLNSLVVTLLDFALDRSQVAGQQVQSFVLRRVEAGVANAPVQPATLTEAKQLWLDTISGDAELAALLEQTMAQSRSIVEINVAWEDGQIIASSNPSRRREPLRAKQDLRSLRRASPLGRIIAIFGSRDDYETRLSLGIPGQKAPVFTIQILESLVLFRDTAVPELRNVMIVSSFALTAAILLAWWAANLALRPLARVSHLIDAIVAGKHEEPAGKVSPNTQEVAVIESKLSLLGERFRDARQDASRLRINLDEVLEKLDVETRRHFENQIRVSQRLTAINSLTGLVAHEIKNPLNSIALRLEMLRGRLLEEAPEAENEISVLSEEVTRLDRVVRTFLDFNRPVDLYFEDVDAAALVEEVVSFLKPEAQHRGVEFHFARPGDGVIIKADDGLLRQAVTNVAMNAIEAMEKGGQLDIGIERNDEFCTIRISDTGPGIPQDYLNKIFQLYFTTKPKGTGIGLAMTFRAVQLHGGTIDVESEPGRGTTFRIALPLASVGAEA